ncbi:tyrosine-protein phosphatase [Microterricola viridarii]|uniref:Protein-tyrosine phosphatase n=1 Tax=Microterricola viridarii TaxID=412690 RepID=A0A1H1S619_9MICO|nr:tyrosine-protein phosphatase [Microterricola viridarii]SDS42709.1 protein-tyrosine phosphatase [Microterricola viridarii]
MNPHDRIPVSGTFNFRDVGGYPAAGGVVRPGKLFRSDGLSKLGDAGKGDLMRLGVGLVIDLRDDFEATMMPDDLDGTGIRTVRLPVFEGSGASQAEGNVSLESLYEKILNEHSDVVVTALRDIADSDGGVLVHCTAGKDRTGVVVALALLVAGVDRETVLADYARSEANLGGEWLDGMLALLAEHGVEATPALRTLMGGSPPEVLDAALQSIEAKHGSVSQYLADSGMPESEIEKLRAALVEPAAEPVAEPVAEPAA